MIKNKEKITAFNGCDSVVQLGAERKNTKIRLLQLTDTQVIDSLQRRCPERLRDDEVRVWLPENFESQCGNHIRSLIAQTNPDLIFITGDIVYGSFDDNGTVLKMFCDFMDSFKIFWAPVFGNHDNESLRGVAWQCEMFEKSKYCLFKRGSVSGNGNYSVGIAAGNELLWVLHMLDSNGCTDSTDSGVIKEKRIFSDQTELMKKNAELIRKAQGKDIGAFVAMHIPVKEFESAEIHKGYKTSEREFYTIGADAKGRGGDFGCKAEKIKTAKTEENFSEILKNCGVKAVFCGHCHNINTCIEYEDIMWVFGLKTGQYDYHIPGQIGGTAITIENDAFSVNHVPSLVRYGPFPSKTKIFDNFFIKI